jgi:tyrosine-protein kinase Etk/Wzc
MTSENSNFIITKPTTDKISNASIKELFSKYYKFIPLVVMCVLLSTTLAYVKLRYTQTMYKQTGRIILKDDERANSNDQLTKLMNGDQGYGNLDNQIEILKSKQLMGKVIDKMNYRSRCFSRGSVLETEQYPKPSFELVPIDLLDSVTNERSFTIQFKVEQDKITASENKIILANDVVTIDGVRFKLVQKATSMGNGNYRVTYYSRQNQIDFILGSLGVILYKPTTTILILTHQSSNPQVSCDIINNIMKEYSTMELEERNVAAKKKDLFIDNAFTTVSRRVDSIEAAIAAFAERNKIINLESQTSAALAKSENVINAIKLENIKLTDIAIIEDLLRDDNRYEKIPPSLSFTDININTLITYYNSRIVSYQNIQSNDNPASIRLKDEVVSAKKEILRALEKIKEVTAKKKKLLEKDFDEESIKITQYPVLNKELLDLSKNKEVDKELLNFLYQRGFENDLSLVSSEPNSKVLEPARPNAAPISPIKRNIYAIALLAGFLIPFLIIYISELINDKVESRYEVEKLTSVPVIGEIGNAGGDTVILPQNSRKVVAEQLRLLRSNINMLVKNKENPSVLFTSSVSGEGKSFISLNLANSIASTGKKVAIFELDLRKPKLSERLKLKTRKGFTNYILGEADKEDIFQAVPGFDNLFLISSGPVPPNPSELLLDNKFTVLFEYVKSKVDFIIIDTAPVGLISDALILGAYADATIYVVRDEYTVRKNLDIVNEMNESKRLPNMSIVINDIKEQKKYGGYKYGGYYYKAYSSSYSSDEAPEETTIVDKIKNFFIKKA